MALRWSANVADNPPMLLAPESFDPKERAYPYADTPQGSLRDNPIPFEPYIRVIPEGVVFVGQRGPIKDVGVNGCQIDDVVTFALGTLQTLNKKFPCRENSLAITKLEEALHWLDARKQDREERKVEGRDQP